MHAVKSLRPTCRAQSGASPSCCCIPTEREPLYARWPNPKSINRQYAVFDVFQLRRNGFAHRLELVAERGDNRGSMAKRDFSLRRLAKRLSVWAVFAHRDAQSVTVPDRLRNRFEGVSFRSWSIFLHRYSRRHPVGGPSLMLPMSADVDWRDVGDGC